METEVPGMGREASNCCHCGAVQPLSFVPGSSKMEVAAADRRGYGSIYCH
jgi:hypothetical protein